MTAAAEAHLHANRTRALDEFLDLLRIPSISSLPEHAGDVQQAAEWVAARMTTAGLEGVRVLPTGGHPVVYGEWLHAAGRPTVLLYGHFDVQPVDPLDLWESPPFEPTIKDGLLYARGASDMKGNLLMGLLAIEALRRTSGALPVNLKCLYEGQEEIGSPQLPEFIATNTDLLACDLVINADGGQWGEDQPSLGVGTKGIAGVQIDVRGARSDLHSGIYGGAVANPIAALAEILASMRTAEGRIMVEGFYDQVIPIGEADRALIQAVPFEEAAYKARIGVAELVGEPGYAPLEQLWARPTLEINGVWGGFQGAGIKTVLPSEAHAKITCRLVRDQDPATIRELLAAHVHGHAPRGVTVAVTPLGIGARPYLAPVDFWGNRAAAGVLREIYGREPLYTRSGGSVPVTELFLRHLGAHSVSFGFSLNDEQIHAPNEFTRLRNFERGQIATLRLLAALGAAERG
jgi:acetylornithine deacetylase/succinyl-diaminopimelate desuccinylase-like protein